MDTIVARSVMVPAADYVAINSQLSRALPIVKRARKWAGIILAISLVGIAVNLWEYGPQVIPNVSFLGVLACISFGYLVFGNKLLHRHLLQTYARNNLPAKYSTDYTFTAEGLSGHNELGSFSAKWPAIQRTEVIGHWLLLYPTIQSCYWIDLNRLEAPATSVDLQKLLAAQRVSVPSLAY